MKIQTLGMAGWQTENRHGRQAAFPLSENTTNMLRLSARFTLGPFPNIRVRGW